MRCRAALSVSALVLGAACTPAVVVAPPNGGPGALPASTVTAAQLVKVHRSFGPSPSPDGASVAFLSDAPGLPQAFVVPVGTTPAIESAWKILAPATERTQFVDYSPDGRFVFFGRDKGGDENGQLYRVAPGGDPVVALTYNPKIRFNYGAVARDGHLVAYASNERDPAFFDVYVRPPDLGEPKRVYEGNGSYSASVFSPDGKKLVVQHEISSFNQDLILVDLESLQRTPLTPHMAEDEVRFSEPRFTPDGHAMFVLTDAGRDFVNVAVIEVGGGPPQPKPRFVLDDTHDATDIAISSDGKALAVAVNIDGWSELRLYDPTMPYDLRPLAKVLLPHGVVGKMEFTKDGRALFVAFSRASLPNEVWRVDVATGKSQRVTASDHAGIDDAQLVEPTVERFKSFDGLEIPVFVFKPRDAKPGEKRPAIVYVHGGPEAQFEPNFNPLVQYLVARGYVVAAPNVRGSTGYGKAYAHLDDVEKREDSVKDLAALHAWLGARPDVAGDRIAVTGGSYGGYMTLAAITLQPELWAAACEVVGIANFRTFLEQTKSYRRALREKEYGSLSRHGELLDRMSPIHKVDKIRAPLLVVHGANDPRVPVGEAEQIVDALKKRGQKVDYLRFENEGHGVFRAENRVTYYERLVQFFDSVMKK